MEESK